jgi:NADH-quinone oxidoreductase subunit G
LPDYFDAVGNEHRGYLLNSIVCPNEGEVEEVAELPTYDGGVVYLCNDTNQFSPFTNKSKKLKNGAHLRGSQQFAQLSKLQDGQKVRFEIDGVEYKRVFMIDTSMKGTIAINPYADMGLSSTTVSYYRFSQPKLEVMDS